MRSSNRRLNSARDSGKHPYLIPYGGSNTIGAYAYMFAMQEFMTWNNSADWIVFSSSSGGTHAGLALGARLFGFQGKILGISVDEPADRLQERVASLVTQTAETLGEDIEVKPDEILVNADYLGGGYGVLGQSELDAIGLFARRGRIALRSGLHW